MSNKFLTRIGNGAPPSSVASKIGLVMSSAGLALSGANFINNKQARKMDVQKMELEKARVKLQEEQKSIDEKSLKALGSINKALTK